MEVFILVLSALTVISLYAYIVIMSKDRVETALSLLVLFLFLFIAGILTDEYLNHNTSIKPLDVYRDKTELKITYEVAHGDTLKCDSTVIYKECFDQLNK